MSSNNLSNLNNNDLSSTATEISHNNSETGIIITGSNDKRGRMNEDIVGKCNKSTQIDFWQMNWRQTPNYNHVSKSRPLSAGFLSKSHLYSNSNCSIGNSSKSLLYSSQSEVTLSPLKTHRVGNNTGKFVAIDIAKIPNLPFTTTSSYSTNNLSGNNSCCVNCCNCNNVNNSESFQLQQSESESPQGLSWRRLHMSRAKLKATATTSELLSGFAMVAMVELQINEPTAVPEWLFVMFAVCTTVLVSVHIFALMISTYLLPNIEAISKLQISRLITESPHERMRGFIELAWAFSTVLGLFLFLVEIAILCWVKFWDYSFMAAMASTIIVIPVLIVFVAFAVHFYHSLVVFKCEASVTDMEELESIKKNLDNVTVNQSSV
ncbi:calcium release-activated calcium channel protein 1 [Microplitis demolitor]|uniref:calcium release-activated calcium channel protein 1 n=1 Tax=Microplitis demolitor TaxID=69319 RepID=UPI0004CDAC86|nr:calcium release-activated calcium channel protein 1 [Microplitis demolitor]